MFSLFLTINSIDLAEDSFYGTYENNSFSGTVTKDSLMKTYLNDTYYNGLNAETKKQIQTYNFKIGGISYSTTVGATKSAEEKDIWNGDIALLSL